MSDVFVCLDALLLDGESLDFKISRAHSKLTVLLIPHLPAASTALTAEAEQARAALCWPLRLEMTAAELDSDFEQRVRGFATQRRVLRESYDVLMSELKEASKTARTKASEKAAARASAKTPAPASEADTKPAPPETAAEPPTETCSSPASRDPIPDMTQPMSLFDSMETPT